MAFTQLSSFTKTVSMLPDNPALTPAALKSQFDAAPSELLTYFNNLITALKQTTSGDSGAKNLGATAISGLTGTDVQTLLQSLKTILDTSIKSNGEGIQVYNIGFLSGAVNFLTLNYTFPTPYINKPIAVLPGDITQTVPYCDRMNTPFINNVSNTGFSVTLSTNSGNLFGSGTLRMNFIVIGK